MHLQARVCVMEALELFLIGNDLSLVEAPGGHSATNSLRF